MAATKRTLDQVSADGVKKLRPIGKPREAAGGIVVVGPGSKIRLKDIDAAGRPATSREEASETVETLRARLAELQQMLYAEHKRSLLMVVQAMDTGGKDGAIKKICSGLDPNGVQLTNFKYPSSEEWDHDFLWRVHANAPRKGSIGIWNRSHYEDVLVPRVHKQITEDVWRERCEDIVAFERLLCRNGVTLIKFFLHISKEESKDRLLRRLDKPDKLWKFKPGDIDSRADWGPLMQAFGDALERCNTEAAPWYVVPADRKWYRNWAIMNILVEQLEEMSLVWPAPDYDVEEQRQRLLASD